MPFSEEIKNEVRKRARSRCVICHEPFVEVHHILPEAQGGSNTIDNAAPLCARCHDLFGGNPDKRNQIRLLRDDFYERIEKMFSQGIDHIAPIPADHDNINALCYKKAAIYHVVFEDESFNTAAKMIYELVYQAQQQKPNYNRVLYLDIDGHRNEAGGFDGDMLELMKEFLLVFMHPYLSEIVTPLYHVENNKAQDNDIPEKLAIYVEATD